MLKRIVIITASLLVIVGVIFGVKELNTYQSNQGGSMPNFTQAQIKAIHENINVVRNQLSPGESAFVFIKEMDNVKPPGSKYGGGLNRVNYPQPYSDINQWKQLTDQDFAHFKIPTLLPKGYSFTKGELKHFMGSIDLANQDKYYEMLKNKATTEKVNMAWQKVESTNAAPSSFDTPTLLYTNENKAQIEIMYSVLPKGVTLFTKSSGPVEKVKVAGFDGEYSVNKNDFISETGAMQAVRWKEEGSEATIQYTVTSPSLNITKDDLLLVATNMK
jgi:hypothetical protein